MPNIRKLQKENDAVNVAIIDAVARKLNKENTSYYSRKGEQKNRQEH